MTLRPKISVIIPCYKQAHFLIEAVASVQGQTFRDWEAIIVDDGSPDNTAVVADLLIASDSRLRLHRKPNGGLSSARNAGIAVSHGEFVQFLDADDLILPRKFELQLARLAEMPPDSIVYTDYWPGKELEPMERLDYQRADMLLFHDRPIMDFSSRWEHGLTIPIHSPLIPRSLLDQLEGPFDTELPNHEDWDFWMRVSRIAAGWEFIENELAIYRVCANSMARKPHSMWSGFAQAIAKQQSLCRDDPEVITALSRLAYANDYQHRKGWARWLRAATEGRWHRLLPNRLRSATYPKIPLDQNPKKGILRKRNS